MVTQGPMDPGPQDVRSAANVLNVEPIVFNTDKPERVGMLAGVVIFLAGTVLVGSCMVMTPTMGSTRSARLEWQRRQLEIEEVVGSEGSEHSVVETPDAAP